MRQLKFLLTSFALFFFLVSFSQPAQASEQIFDQANLFSESQRQDISSKMTEFSDQTGMDVVVVTTNDAGGKTAKAYADDFYNNGGYGSGTDQSGFLFLIDMDNRTYHISTKGKMKILLTESRIDSMLDHAEGDMKDGNYDLAAISVINDAIKYNQKYTYDSATGTFKRVRSFTPLKTLIAVIAGILAGIAGYSSVYGTYNLKRSTYKYSYREKQP